MWYASSTEVMKTPKKHPHQALSSVGLQKKKPGRYADGGGLYLLVDPSGARRWILRTVIQGRRTDMGLGSLALVGLKEAREKAAGLRKLAREGGDPVAERQRARVGVPTFEQAARKVHAEHSATWRNPKHAAQWLTTLKVYAFPKFGSKRVDQVGTPDVLEALLPIWHKKPETARRVRQRIGTVLDWAKAAGHRAGDNPVAGVVKGLPRQDEGSTHHAALPFTKVPGFIEELRASDSAELVRLAFEFLILTCSRTSEVILATKHEIDGDTWTIPAARMKAGREHRVPLAPRALEILARARELAGAGNSAQHTGDFLFPGRSIDKPLSNMAFLMTLRRMGVKITAHGFRSSFRDWAAEKTNFPSEVCEMALAHVVSDKTEAAYRRGDLFEKRRELMASWAAFATAKKGDVIPIHVKPRKKA